MDWHVHESNQWICVQIAIVTEQGKHMDGLILKTLIK
ncbi:hypothetical protein J2S17_005047 [Cytobacillus purgationiresistens]|uniref:Uncharacterized protein n=1 Tax=Cytobacillus purgationiresistens TaxID=863449 RepID=A0ABU0APB8_9BACI|nr:hypothetical protein [Cytobacillus purgationiresistens]